MGAFHVSFLGRMLIIPNRPCQIYDVQHAVCSVRRIECGVQTESCMSSYFIWKTEMILTLIEDIAVHMRLIKLGGRSWCLDNYELLRVLGLDLALMKA